MKLASLSISLFAAFSLLTLAEEKIDIEKYRAESVEQWEDDIQEFEKRDKEETHPEDGVLFIGSSSIRLWENIATDMAPYHPIQRGFGGSKISDLVIFADRIVSPHKFRAVVIFVANDIKGKPEEDKSPEEVAALFSHLHKQIRSHNSDAPIFYIAITPTEKRAHAWKEQNASNLAIRDLCRQLPQTYFIGTESIYTDNEGNPKPELFKSDQLHLNETGYHLWAAAIKSHLDSYLK